MHDSASEPEVICEKRGHAGVITMNRPKALNALTLTMVRDMAQALDEWELDPSVRHIVLTGAGGKAFCAGGDIRKLYDLGKVGRQQEAVRFWREEYILNHRIKTYSKPYVSLIDGICMGGGAGVSLPGSYQVAGDNYLFAMPEVGIGFFPDVGASYFLPRLPDHSGFWLALTGGRIRLADAMALGLAGHYVPTAKFPALFDALAAAKDVGSTIAAFAEKPPGSTLRDDCRQIEAVLSLHDGSKIVEQLEGDEASSLEFARKTAATIRTKSPMSLAITLAQMHRGKGLASFADVMKMEFRIVSRICHGHDFYEGIRAVLVDKDNAPHWQPASFDAVDPAAVDAHFASLGDDELVFPVR
ncbi:enoyl-CoA hydratase/isomerase family protein [Methylovirgula sp. 4M-Z18]|uniref:enoyl-CoA hydratase/isomerase family protein n=1 Tax=Methylovirgula sp. 4M-Z18 TaxID=2293567 RepID=UPI000E2FCD92|nr:enoyl-CoA hydratase/isomerase family protein [Methylovirgula sp. 4M-Z18]RFB80307.1 enoyl-CoA hydratase/isomerase family protein [Methylovirgula sp. 4M-Z18]